MEESDTCYGGRVPCCTAVGDVPACAVSSGEFAVDDPQRVRTNSEGFDPQQYILCPHLVKSEPTTMNLPASIGLKNKDVSPERSSIRLHKLHTQVDTGGGVDPLSWPGSDTYRCTEAGSPSPSPLSEPAFEPYVVCTKTRSCSDESHCSSSSGGERLLEPGSWTYDKDGASRSAPLLVPCASSGGVSSSSDGGSAHSRSCDSLERHHFAMMCPPSPAGGQDGGFIGQKKKLLISPNHDSPQVLCETRPVLPPAPGQSRDSPTSPLFFPSFAPSPPPPYSSHRQIRPLTPPTPASSGLHASLHMQRSRAVTFHQCNAGEESGRFSADYLGMKEVDMYLKSINSVAKDLAMTQRPKEIQVFVASERIRLAPPNSPTLFRSFLVKEVLLVQRCSKNKRIIGVMLWKQRKGRVPVCHILRCQDDLVANALYSCIWQQTQKVDEVTFSKVNRIV